MLRAKLKRDQPKRDIKTEWWWEDLPGHTGKGRSWISAMEAARCLDEDTPNIVPAYGTVPGVS